MVEEKIPVSMILDFENYIPAILPKSNDSFLIRHFENEQLDKQNWVDILLECDEVKDSNEGDHRFSQLSLEGVEKLFSQMFFAIDSKSNETIGTISAWHGEFENVFMGRIHWLSVRPQFQNVGVASSLLSTALALLSKSFDKVYLNTSNKNLIAIKLYIKFGFKPVISNKADEMIWDSILQRIDSL